MIILLSPAKIQNFDKQSIIADYTQPQFSHEAEELIQLLRQLSASELAKLLETNAKISQQNIDRHLNWHLPFTAENAKQTVLVFNGEVFHGLDAKSLNPEEFSYMQSHLRILSGLYGILRPLDLIQPYRLDVSTKLANNKGENIYAFWGNKITKYLNLELAKINTEKIILNLTSGEYIKSINKKDLNAKVIDIEFYQYKNGEISSAVVYTKKARGMLARYILQNKIENEENVKGFNAEGYWFNPQMSTETKYVFIK